MRICSEPACSRKHYARGYCSKHYMALWERGVLRPLPKRSAEERFWEKVDKRSARECWPWLGWLDVNGYGQAQFLRTLGHSALVHRFSYVLAKGPIPATLVMDHLCRNRRCVNPDHLEAVTIATNVMRGIGPAAVAARRTHCKRGHELVEENIYRVQGSRRCKVCVSIRRRARYWSAREAADAAAKSEANSAD